MDETSQWKSRNETGKCGTVVKTGMMRFPEKEEFTVQSSEGLDMLLRACIWERVCNAVSARGQEESHPREQNVLRTVTNLSYQGTYSIASRRSKGENVAVRRDDRILCRARHPQHKWR